MKPTDTDPVTHRARSLHSSGQFLGRSAAIVAVGAIGATMLGGVASAAVPASNSSGQYPAAGAQSRPGPHGPRLTDEQKSCLKATGVTKPQGPPTKAQREQFQAAAASCNISLPPRPEGVGGPGRGPRLTDEQKSCLKAAGVTKPQGRPTYEQREAFEAAAASCNITLPPKPSGRS